MSVLKKNGVAIIDKAVGQFEVIVTKLTSGLALVEEKHEENTKEIQSLSAENIFLDKKIEQASTFKDNLMKMLGEKTSKKDATPKKDNSILKTEK